MATHKTAVRRVKNRRSWAVRFLLIALVVFLLLKGVQVYGQIRGKKQQEAELDRKIHTQVIKNESLLDQVENADDYREHKAYEDGYGLPGQQFYQSEAG